MRFFKVSKRRATELDFKVAGTYLIPGRAQSGRLGLAKCPALNISVRKIKWFAKFFKL